MNQLKQHSFCVNTEPFFPFPSGPAPELMLIYFLILVWSKGDSIDDFLGNWIANGYSKKSLLKSKCSQRKCWLHLPNESCRLFLKI